MPSAKTEEKNEWFELTTAQVMEVIGVSRMSVTNFMDAGMPKLARGTYDVRAVVQWYVARKQEEFDKRIANLGSEEAETRYRLAKAESAELDLAVKRGQLVPVDKVLSMWETHIGSAKAKLMAIPSRMATLVLAAQSKQEVQALLEEVQREGLNELATIHNAADHRAVAGPADGKAAAHVANTKKAKVVRVGRRKKVHPSRRKSNRARSVAHVQS